MKVKAFNNTKKEGAMPLLIGDIKGVISTSKNSQPSGY